MLHSAIRNIYMCILMYLNTRHLLCAIEVAETGTVVQAANNVHLTQSAVTQGLLALEQQLHVQLFERSNQGMRLTQAGELFLRRGKRAFAQLKEAAQWWFAPQSSVHESWVRNLTWKQLCAFSMVCQSGSYSAAARRLQLTQPTLHRTLKDFQELCQAPLFYRSPAGVDIPWRTRQLSRYVGLFFAEINQGIDEVQALQSTRAGRLAIGCLPLAQTKIVPAAILALLQQYPLADISVVDGPYEEQLQALLHGQLDMLVGALRFPLPHSEITQVTLFMDELSLVARAGHPLLSSTSLSVADLQHYPWVAPRKNTPARDVFERVFSEEGLPLPEDIIECGSMVVSRGILMASDRLSLLPSRQVEVELQSATLALLDFELGNTQRAIGYALRRNWQPTQVQAAFLRLLEQQVAS